MTTEQVLAQLMKTLARLADHYERIGYEERDDNRPLTSKFFLGEANGYVGAKLVVEQLLDAINYGDKDIGE